MERIYNLMSRVARLERLSKENIKPEDVFFDNPKHERTKLFLEQIL